MTLRHGELELNLTMEEMKNTDDGTESLEESDSDISEAIDVTSAGKDDELLTTHITKKYQGEKTNSSEWVDGSFISSEIM